MPVQIASTPTPRKIMREQPRKPSFQFSESFREKLAMATSRVGLVQLLRTLQIIVSCRAVDLFVSIFFQDPGLDFDRP